MTKIILTVFFEIRCKYSYGFCAYGSLRHYTMPICFMLCRYCYFLYCYIWGTEKFLMHLTSFLAQPWHSVYAV